MTAICSSKVRSEILCLLFGAEPVELHIREIERRCGLTFATVRQDLLKLAGQGLVTMRRSGNRLYCRANRSHPLYPELRSLVLKEERIMAPHADSIRRAVRVLADDFGADEIWLFGSCAAGTADEHSDIDLLVVRPERADTPRPGVEARLCLSRHGVHRPFDLLVLTPARWRAVKERPAGVYADILERGIRLHEG
jgi:predicted nucleotidyltransferase